MRRIYYADPLMRHGLHDNDKNKVASAIVTLDATQDMALNEVIQIFLI